MGKSVAMTDFDVPADAVVLATCVEWKRKTSG
jgi:hypothetical protein